MNIFSDLLHHIYPKRKQSYETLLDRLSVPILLCDILHLGIPQQSQSFHFRIGKATVSKIIKETCTAIWRCLNREYLQPPQSSNRWKRIADDFEELWGFPHCLGAGDGKHVIIDCPKKSGSTYFNYKGTFSILLLAYCDTKYQFTLGDIGQYGSQNDSGTYNDSSLSGALANNTLNMPSAENLEGCNLQPLQYVLVVDEDLPLKYFQMHPWPGRNLSEDHAIFNYRLSRASRVIENCFGILTTRWQIFPRPICPDVSLVRKIVKTTVCLHNYLRLTDNAMYCPIEFVDSEDSSGEIREGEWRTIVAADHRAFQNIETSRG